jgi:cytochrome P450
MQGGADASDLMDDFARLLAAGEFELGELATSCATFLMAGHENTSHFIGNLFHMLFSNREQMQQVLDDRSLLPRFMDETLRYRGVVPFVTREVLKDFEFEGRQLKTGQLVSLSLFSANRDDSTFDNVDTFDFNNATAKYHLGFGHGEEYCRGSHLALMETEELVNFLFDRYPKLEAVDGGMEVQCQPMLRQYITRFDMMLNP